MEIGPVVLEGAHVRLEWTREEHFVGLVAAGVGRGLFRFFPNSLESESAMRAFVTNSSAGLAAGSILPFATIDQMSGRIVGSTCYLAIEPAHKRLEIGGTWITPSHPRSPVNTEAKLLKLTHCFEVLGAVEEGTFRAHMVMLDGQLRSSVYFGVIASEWPEVKARLVQ